MIPEHPVTLGLTRTCLSAAVGSAVRMTVVTAAVRLTVGNKQLTHKGHTTVSPGKGNTVQADNDEALLSVV